MVLLLGIRVICQEEFRALPQLQYDKETTQQLTAQTGQVKAASPWYSRPVDLEGENGAWMSIVRETQEIFHLVDDSLRKAKVLLDHEIFLERHDVISRSDRETKFDVRLEKYFRIYDEQRHLQNQPQISQQLNAALMGQGGRLHRNYLEPKDRVGAVGATRRRQGHCEWQHWWTKRRLGCARLRWLATCAVSGSRCAAFSVSSLEAAGKAMCIPMGKT